MFSPLSGSLNNKNDNNKNNKNKNKNDIWKQEQ